MIDATLDTAIVIDILRGYPSATSWLQQKKHVLGVTRYVWLEVLEGCDNKREQAHAIRILNRFDTVPIENVDVENAVDMFLKHYLRSNTGMLDCLIAAPSYRLQIPLYTRNLKHFRPLLGSLAVAPY